MSYVDENCHASLVTVVGLQIHSPTHDVLFEFHMHVVIDQDHV
jgi:hypothetical protein